MQLTSFPPHYILALELSVHMKCYNMRCDGGMCEIEVSETAKEKCLFSETAKEKCLFFLSTKTCAGDEIGWD